MKSRLALLLSVPLAFACGEADQAALLEPAGSADVTTQDAPVEGTFIFEVRYPGLPAGGSCSLVGTMVAATGDPPTYALPSDEGTFCIVFQLTSPVVTKPGTLLLSRCESRETGFDASSTACTEAGGGGRWMRLSRRGTSVLNGRVSFVFSAGDRLLNPGETFGFRLQYFGRGNGVKNVILPPFDVTRPAP